MLGKVAVPTNEDGVVLQQSEVAPVAPIAPATGPQSPGPQIASPQMAPAPVLSGPVVSRTYELLPVPSQGPQAWVVLSPKSSGRDAPLCALGLRGLFLCCARYGAQPGATAPAQGSPMMCSGTVTQTARAQVG